MTPSINAFYGRRQHIPSEMHKGPVMPRKLSASVIRARIRTLEAQARRLEDTVTEGLRAAAAIIVKYGLSLADLRQAFATSKKVGRRSPVARRRVPVKYRDAKGNTWTGRGRPPLWLVAAEKDGRNRESFLIRTNGSKEKRTSRRSASVKRAIKKANAAST